MMKNKRYSLLIVLLCFILSQEGLADPRSHSNTLAIDANSNCSQQAENFFFLMPYSARTDPSEEGGTVEEVANDGFTALGLNYQIDENYTLELNEWLNTDLCLIYRLSPKRTVVNAFSPDYYGPIGTLIRINTSNGQACLTQKLSNTQLNPPYLCEEIGGASDEQMDIWIEQIEQLIIQAVNNPLVNSRIIAWYIMPEEIDLNVPREKELLQRLYQTVQSHDPLQRPAWLYNANNTSSEKLINIAAWVDAFSMGIYPNIAGNSHQRIQVRHALTQMTSANATLKHPKQILPVLEMFESTEYPINAEDTLLIPEFVRHDAYAAFANGADGLLIYSMGFRQGFDSYSTYYEAWSQVVHELTDLGLQAVIRNGLVLNEASIHVTNGEVNIPFNWGNFNETYPSLSIRDWNYNEKNYVLIVNSSEGSVSFILDNIASGLYKDIFTKEIVDGTDGFAALSLPARGVIFLESKPAGTFPDSFTTVQ